MPGTGNFFFIRSSRLRGSEAITIDGVRLWDSSNATFARINALCGDGAAKVFAEPTVKNQDDSVMNVAWFGSFDDDAKDLTAIDRAKLARVEEDLVQRLDALKPALADSEIGATVAAMLNIYDHRSIVAVGEHAVITNWGALPSEATTSQASYARHIEATIGRFIRSDVSPSLPGRSWTAHGGIEPLNQIHAARERAPAAVAVASTVAAQTMSPLESQRSRWWIPAALVVFFGAILTYVAWPGNLVYDKEAPVEQGVLAQLDTANETVSQNIASLREELNKDACSIDPTIVGLPAREAAAVTPGGTDKKGSKPDATAGQGEAK
jgi:hypothetical protein